MIGAGVYAVHADGRARWGARPKIVSDDKFARLHFTPSERVVLDGACFRIRMPAGFSNGFVISSLFGTIFSGHGVIELDANGDVTSSTFNGTERDLCAELAGP